MTWDGEWWQGDLPAPASGGGHTTWRDRLAPLLEEPGVWARFGPFAFGSVGKQVGKIRRGCYGEGLTAHRRSEAGEDFIFVKYEDPS